MNLAPSSMIPVLINFWQLNWLLCRRKRPAVWNRTVFLHRRYAFISLPRSLGAFQHRRRQKWLQCHTVLPVPLFAHYQPVRLVTCIPFRQFLTADALLHLLLCRLLVNLKRLLKTLQWRHIYAFFVALILWIADRSIPIVNLFVSQVFDWADWVAEHGFGFCFWVATWGEWLDLGFGGVFGGELLYRLGGWGEDALLFFEFEEVLADADWLDVSGGLFVVFCLFVFVLFGITLLMRLLILNQILF